MNWSASRTGGVASFYQWMVIKHFQSEQLLIDVMFGIKKKWLEQTQAACNISENVHVIACARGHMVLYLCNQWYELFMETSLTGTAIPGKSGNSHLCFLFCVNSVILFLCAGVNRSYKAALCPASRSTTLNAVLRCRSINAFRLFLALTLGEHFLRNRRIWFTFIYVVITALKFEISISRQWLEILQHSRMSCHHHLHCHWRLLNWSCWKITQLKKK